MGERPPHDRKAKNTVLLGQNSGFFISGLLLDLQGEDPELCHYGSADEGSRKS